MLTQDSQMSRLLGEVRSTRAGQGGTVWLRAGERHGGRHGFQQLRAPEFESQARKSTCKEDDVPLQPDVAFRFHVGLGVDL